MVKNILSCILKILIVPIIYVIQIYVLNETRVFGQVGNLSIALLLVITIFEKTSIAYIYALVLGIISDVLFYTIPAQNVICYLILVTVILGLKKTYRQDSKLTVIIYSVCGTVVYELLMWLFNMFKNAQFINVLAVISMILKICVINIFITFVMYIIYKNLFAKEGLR